MHLISQISATHARHVNDISTAEALIFNNDLASKLIHQLRRGMPVVSDIGPLDIVAVAIGYPRAEVGDFRAVREIQSPGIIPPVAV